MEDALRRNNIETSSRLDTASVEDWKRVVDRESASADGYIFLLGAGASSTPPLQTEWRSLVRNDWESKKPLVPVIHALSVAPKDLPPFLPHRRAIFTTNFDDAIGELRYLIEHPSEGLDRTHEQQSRTEFENRLSELKNYALSLKQESAVIEAKLRWPAVLRRHTISRSSSTAPTILNIGT
jgi:hypothetical protein